MIQKKHIALKVFSYQYYSLVPPFGSPFFFTSGAAGENFEDISLIFGDFWIPPCFFTFQTGGGGIQGIPLIVVALREYRAARQAGDPLDEVCPGTPHAGTGAQRRILRLIKAPRQNVSKTYQGGRTG